MGDRFKVTVAIIPLVISVGFSLLGLITVFAYSVLGNSGGTLPLFFWLFVISAPITITFYVNLLKTKTDSFFWLCFAPIVITTLVAGIRLYL